MRVCPFEESVCGPQQQYLLNKTSQAVSGDLSLGVGDLCFYQVRAQCGVPAF